MMWPNPFNPYEGGPTVIEWLKQVCDKFNELLTAIKNVRELPAGGSHGQVPTPKKDGSGYEWVDQSGGGGGGTSDLLWKPTVSTAGVISWARSSSTTAPANQNIKGPQGATGPQGKPGVKGDPGPTGPTGPTGPRGATGETGPQGLAGTPGKDGATPTFEVGTVTKLDPDAEPTVTLESVGGDLYMMDFGIPQGQPGTPGGGGTSDLLWTPTVSTTGVISWARSSSTTAPASQNIKGPQGATGPQGKPGVKGDPGPTGPTGPTGPRGATGETGPQGLAGTPGKDGATPTFEVGTVTKLDPDAEPTVTLESVGGDLYMMDFGIPQGQPGTPGGGGGGDVTASGNNVFTGTNHFEGLTVLGETHVETPNDDNDATNKLYVDTLVSTTKTATVNEVNQHTTEVVNALRVLPAGGTAGQVPTIAPDGTAVEWKTPETGGGSGGGGVEWVEVALTNTDRTIGEVHLFYDKADNTHLKMLGYFTSSVNLKAASFTLPDNNPLDYGHSVVAALPVSNCIYLSFVLFNGTTVTIENKTPLGSTYYHFVGTEFYVVPSAPMKPEVLREPTDIPLPDPTIGE